MSSWVARAFVGVVAVALVIVAIAVAPHFGSGGSAASPRPELATAAVRSFPVTVGASGTVVPASQLGVDFNSPGRLVEIDARVGATVAKGTVLARLDDAVARSDVAQAQASIAGANATLALARVRNIATEIAAAQAQVAASIAQLQGKQAELADRSLVAPIAGTVQQVNGQIGENVAGAATAAPTLPGTTAPIPAAAGAASPQTRPFVVLGDATNFVIGAAFSSTDTLKLAAGQTGTITADTAGGVSIPCHVLAIAHQASVVNGASLFYASVIPDAPSDKLTSGLVVDVSIKISQANNVLAVVRSAVYQLAGISHVDVWDGKRSLSTVVSTGVQGTELIQVTSGLTAGQQVVLSAFHGLPQTAISGVGSP
jgi:macrolide-specific efflux system membrane fusion protein